MMMRWDLAVAEDGTVRLLEINNQASWGPAIGNINDFSAANFTITQRDWGEWFQVATDISVKIHQDPTWRPPQPGVDHSYKAMLASSFNTAIAYDEQDDWC
eukprot:TRINITY_DN65784_c0_g1_i4.p1 TRINITY_DN65784_c0_g1~~TRINITY_DN65784_c0_g1_i4.p1  ORF type:complete len:101 (-),score=14.94 TRINITY_DN65784_c0_g1_i4:127-429(-)